MVFQLTLSVACALVIIERGRMSDQIRHHARHSGMYRIVVTPPSKSYRME
jgi:hypothetical protein